MEPLEVISVNRRFISRQSVLLQVFSVMVFAALTAVGARIEIPHRPVPYTFQTFFVLLSGAFLGKRNGSLSQGVYLLAGACGLPVFAQGGAGVLSLIGPTGGYLLGFPVAAFLIGASLEHPAGYFRTLLSMAAGLAVIFALGAAQLNFTLLHDWGQAWTGGFLIFSWWDGLKLVSAAILFTTLPMRRLPEQG